MAFFRGDFFSNELQMTTGINVIIPDGIKVDEANVLYLFHGLSDNCTNWSRLTSVERYANMHRVCVVMPEVQRAYYTDMKFGIKYFQYVSRELIEVAHRFFNISTKREKTYVAGLSMGGYGAMKCALTRPEQYSACGAFSSLCDVRNTIEERMPAANLEELYAILGAELEIEPENDLYLLAEKCAKAQLQPRLFMTCGTSDMLYTQNLAIKAHYEKLLKDYQFLEWEGDHTWDFWDKSLQLAMEFFFGVPKGHTPTPLYDGEIK